MNIKKLSFTFSIGYLIDETDPNVKDHQPLFEVALELQEPNLVFVPSLGEDSAFMDLILTIEEEIFGVGKLVPRVASHKEWPDYEVINLYLEGSFKTHKVEGFIKVVLSA